MLGGLAALYTGLKLRAAGYGPKQLADIFVNKPWLRAIIGGGVLAKIYSDIDKERSADPIFGPASNYENVLQDTQLSGHMSKSASAGTIANVLGTAGLTGAVVYPSAYIINAYNQKSLRRKGKSLFPGAGMAPKQMAITGAVSGGAGALISQRLSKIKNALKSIR